MTEQEAYEVLVGLPPEVQLANALERMFEVIREAGRHGDLRVNTQRTDGCFVRYSFEFIDRAWAERTRPR